MDDETRHRLKALESRLRRLEATNAVLVELLGEADVEAKVRQRLKGTELVDLGDEDSAQLQDAVDGGVRGSVYRGASTTAAMGALTCGVCRRLLDPEAPEITLRKVGRVCLLCSQRQPR